MTAIGVLLLLGAAAYLADVAVTNSLGTQLDMFGSTVTGLTNAKVLLIGAAAGFVLALGLAMIVAGQGRRNRTRRRHRAALAEQRAETERLAAELERERSARSAPADATAAHGMPAVAPSGDQQPGTTTGVVYPTDPARTDAARTDAARTDDPLYRTT